MVRVKVLCAAVLLMAGCSRSPEPRQYQLNGQIVSIAPERREVTIKHQDIPNFMPGMTMPFVVEDAALLDGKAAGDLVSATLVVGETSAHLSTLTRTGHQPIEAPAPRIGARPGDQVPDAPLVDQDGATRPLASFRGHRVALTFIYTRCPLPEFCPLMTRNFVALQKTLRSRPDLSDVRLVSVTLDPAFDTPAVLKAHARAFNADPAIWSFLTGPASDVRMFAEQFGIYVEAQPDDPAQITHSLRTAVIGADGRLVANHTGNDWTPDGLLADITKATAPGN
jgi:protein SCO1/2